MKIRNASLCGIALLALAGSGAHAQLAPFALAISETISHQDNLFRDVAGTEVADWISNTDVRLAVDLPLGRQKFKASAALGLDRYRSNTQLNHQNHAFAAELDWSSADLLTGELGASTTSQLYQYGLSGSVPYTGRNIERVSRVFSRAQLGGVTPWTLLGGVEATRQRFSADVFAVEEKQQWMADLGARYQASPDLGITGVVRHTQGRYPKFSLANGSDDFQLQGLDVAANWVASGASAVDAVVGYTIENHRLQPDRRYWNGSLRWTWTPSGHLKVITGLRRDTNSDSAMLGRETTTTNLQGKTLNTGAGLSVLWNLSSKIDAIARANYVQRRFGDALFDNVLVSGADQTRSLSLGGKYVPLSAVELECSAAHETKTSNVQNPAVSRPYTATTLGCSGKLMLR